jgi:hypothetical protein
MMRSCALAFGAESARDQSIINATLGDMRPAALQVNAGASDEFIPSPSNSPSPCVAWGSPTDSNAPGTETGR